MKRPIFDAIVEEVMIAEGGFVDHPSDPGGATKFGVSLRFLEDLNKRTPELFNVIFPGQVPDRRLVRRLTKVQAKMVFDFCFWRPLDLGNLPGEDIPREVADLAYHSGIRQSVKTLQRAANWVVHRDERLKFMLLGKAPLQVDGQIGPKTKSVVKSILRNVGDDDLLTAFEMYRKQFYATLVERKPSLSVFLKGWNRRAVAEDTNDLDPDLEGDTDT